MHKAINTTRVPGNVCCYTPVVLARLVNMHATCML